MPAEIFPVENEIEPNQKSRPQSQLNVMKSTQQKQATGLTANNHAEQVLFIIAERIKTVSAILVPENGVVGYDHRVLAHFTYYIQRGCGDTRSSFFLVSYTHSHLFVVSLTLNYSHS